MLYCILVDEAAHLLHYAYAYDMQFEPYRPCESTPYGSCARYFVIPSSLNECTKNSADLQILEYLSECVQSLGAYSQRNRPRMTTSSLHIPTHHVGFNDAQGDSVV